MNYTIRRKKEEIELKDYKPALKSQEDERTRKGCERMKAVTEKSYAPDVVEDAEKLLNALENVQAEKRPFVVTIMTAYMNGLEAGEVYAMQRMGKREMV